MPRGHGRAGPTMLRFGKAFKETGFLVPLSMRIGNNVLLDLKKFSVGLGGKKQLVDGAGMHPDALKNEHEVGEKPQVCSYA